VHPVAWVEAIALIALTTLGVTWLGVVFGLIGKTPAGANSLSLIFLLLAFTSSAFVNPATMPIGVRQFAEYQPFTPVIDTLRGLLLGTPISAGSPVLAIIWGVVLTLVGYLWSLAIYDRNSVAFNLSGLR
jgi:ABC-2 type transport system permease protein